MSARTHAIAVALLLGCGPKPVTTTPGQGSPPADDVIGAKAGPPGADRTPAPPTRAHTCGTAGLQLDDYDWIPADARVAVTIALGDADTSAALQQLAEHGRSSEHNLPITFAFAVTQWPIVVPVLGSLLDAIGMQPDEVVFLSPAKGPAFAWVIKSDCDLDESIARVAEAWGLHATKRVEGVVASAPPDPGAGDGTLREPPKAKRGDDEEARERDAERDMAFPYDVVFATGQRVALVPRGYGDAFLTALSEASSTAAWSERVAAIEAAPVRGILSGRALLGSKAKRTPAASALRVRSDGVFLDAMVEPEMIR